MARSSPVLLPMLALAAAATLFTSHTFVPPAAEIQSMQGRVLAQSAAAATALTAGALPVLAEELDAAEAYNQKWLTATGYCLSLCFFLVFIIISQGKKLVENKWLN
eukprot:CAMPEP_0172872524 /NCGR_PEP_ID=MMETSP1075-20121228/92681_1 /TAXON_ID=2916 /ORGANISM="Ceratium fusus, Strain PA161109" /LENGTH=105 /DNA_ID=CAMNT_0013722853 /DNA_START=51 /DNA_END=368 /DNA_ORIENTATION=+